MSTYWPVGLQNSTTERQLFRYCLAPSLSLCLFTGNAPDRSRRVRAHISRLLVKHLVEQRGFKLFPTACSSCFCVIPHTRSSFCRLILRRSMPFTMVKGNSTVHHSIISITSLPTREITFATGGKPTHCDSKWWQNKASVVRSVLHKYRLCYVTYTFTRQKSLKVLIKVVGSGTNVCIPP